MSDIEYDCPPDCGGCSCHVAPPCSHCVDHVVSEGGEFGLCQICGSDVVWSAARRDAVCSGCGKRGRGIEAAAECEHREVDWQDDYQRQGVGKPDALIGHCRACGQRVRAERGDPHAKTPYRNPYWNEDGTRKMAYDHDMDMDGRATQLVERVGDGQYSIATAVGGGYICLHRGQEFATAATADEAVALCRADWAEGQAHMSSAASGPLDNLRRECDHAEKPGGWCGRCEGRAPKASMGGQLVESMREAVAHSRGEADLRVTALDEGNEAEAESWAEDWLRAEVLAGRVFPDRESALEALRDKIAELVPLPGGEESAEHLLTSFDPMSETDPLGSFFDGLEAMANRIVDRVLGSGQGQQTAHASRELSHPDDSPGYRLFRELSPNGVTRHTCTGCGDSTECGDPNCDQPRETLCPSCRPGKQASLDRTAMQSFDVILDGDVIDTVFYGDDVNVDEDEVKRSLINHDGYDPNIEVRRVGRKPKRKKVKTPKGLDDAARNPKDTKPNVELWTKQELLAQAKDTVLEMLKDGPKTLQDMVDEVCNNYGAGCDPEEILDQLRGAVNSLELGDRKVRKDSEGRFSLGDPRPDPEKVRRHNEEDARSGVFTNLSPEEAAPGGVWADPRYRNLSVEDAPENPSQVPGMGRRDRQRALDQLLDQYSQEQDPDARELLERKMRELQASLRRTAAEGDTVESLKAEIRRALTMGPLPEDGIRRMVERGQRLPAPVEAAYRQAFAQMSESGEIVLGADGEWRMAEGYSGPRAAPRRSSPASPASGPADLSMVKSIPPEEIQRRKDALMDQFSAGEMAQDEFEARMEQLRSMGSLRRQADEGEQEAPEEEFPQDSEPSDDDIIIADERGVYRAYSSGRMIAEQRGADAYDALLWDIKQWMERSQYWPNVWLQEERGGHQIVSFENVQEPIPSEEQVRNAGADVLSILEYAPQPRSEIEKQLGYEGHRPMAITMAFDALLGTGSIVERDGKLAIPVSQSRPGTMTSDTPLPTMDKHDISRRQDSLLDQLSQEQDPAKRQQIEERLRSLRASLRVRAAQDVLWQAAELAGFQPEVGGGGATVVSLELGDGSELVFTNYVDEAGWALFSPSPVGYSGEGEQLDSGEFEFSSQEDLARQLRAKADELGAHQPTWADNPASEGLGGTASRRQASPGCQCGHAYAEHEEDPELHTMPCRACPCSSYYRDPMRTAAALPPFPKPGEHTGRWGWVEDTDLDELWFLVNNDYGLYQQAQAWLRRAGTDPEEASEAAHAVSVSQIPQIVEFLRANFGAICHKYPPEPLQSGESDMAVDDVPVESPDALLDRFNAGGMDADELKRRMRQLGELARGMGRTAESSRLQEALFRVLRRLGTENPELYAQIERMLNEELGLGQGQETVPEVPQPAQPQTRQGWLRLGIGSEGDPKPDGFRFSPDPDAESFLSGQRDAESVYDAWANSPEGEAHWDEARAAFPDHNGEQAPDAADWLLDRLEDWCADTGTLSQEEFEALRDSLYEAIYAGLT